MKKLLVLLISLGTYSTAHGGNSSSASKAMQLASMAVVVNAATGEKLMGKCPLPGGSWACPLAAMSFAQVASTGSSASSAGDVSSAFDYSNGFSGFDEMGTVTYDGKTYTPQDLAKLQTSAKENLDKLKSQGYSVDPATGEVTTPGGSAPASSMGSGAAMAAAGLIDESMIDEYDDQIKKIQNQKIDVVSMGTSGGGGGGARSGARTYKSSYDDYDPYAALRAMQRKPASAKTQGLTKNFGGDPVGISTDNIFDMLHRNYQKKVQAREFVQ